MMKKASLCCTVKVPATSANLGPGFDCLGVALNLLSHVTLVRDPQAPKALGMIDQAANAFFKASKIKPWSFSTRIETQVPISRGLGSSVTIRLGVVAGLNALSGSPLKTHEVLTVGVNLEGHPDNAVPAFYGGFAACSGERFVRTEVDTGLKFIAFIPEITQETKQARAILPRQISQAHAIANLSNTALITAAFLQRNYGMLEGLLVDHLHQPVRVARLPYWRPLEKAAIKAGALSFYLSGSGSTVMALALEKPRKIAEAMAQAAAKAGTPGEVRILEADNQGVVVQKG